MPIRLVSLLCLILVASALVGCGNSATIKPGYGAGAGTAPKRTPSGASRTMPCSATQTSFQPDGPLISDLPKVEVTLVRVVDGDTIVIKMPDGSQEKLRYIGIDAPESVQPEQPVEYLGKEASLHNASLLDSGSLRISFDIERYDEYGRMLAYVWAGSVFLNGQMVRDGYARAKDYPPNMRYQEFLTRAEQEARDARVGLWAFTTTVRN